MVIAGIDYSLNSPAMFIMPNGATKFNEGYSFFLTSKKKFNSTFANIRGDIMPIYNSEQQRYDVISEYFVDLIIDYKVDFVMIEGYSMGSTGSRVFNIGEHGGVLKHKLYKEDIKFDVIAPTSVKKFATGKGNAKKSAMYDNFIESCGVDLEAILQSKKMANPISDIVDSFFIAKYGIEMAKDFD